MSDRPYFLWDMDVTEEQLLEKLKAGDADARAQWQGWVMAEARFSDVWKYLSVDEVQRDWPHIRRHLGRTRAYWQFLLDGWRRLGLIHG